MTHDSTDPHGEASLAEAPAQGIFIGWLAIGLLALMAVFAILLIAAGASQGFS